MDTRTPKQQALDALEEQAGMTFTSRQRDILDVAITDETHEWGTEQHRVVEELHHQRFVEDTPVGNGKRADHIVMDEATQIWQDADKALIDELARERAKNEPDVKRAPNRQERRAYQRKVATAIRKAAKRDRALRYRLSKFSLEEMKMLEAEVARLSSGR